MIHTFVFSEGKMVGQNIDMDALRLLRSDKGLMLWVDLDEPTPEETKLILEEIFNFHPLAVEDCTTPSHFPKLEDYEEYLFMVMHAVDFSRTEKFNTTELDFFLGRDFLVTYHNNPLKSVMAVRDRYAKNIGPIARGPDRLAHLVLNAMVELYKPVTQELLSEVEELEDNILLSSDSKKLIEEILNTRREINDLRQIIRPQMEVINRLARGESKLIRANLLPYYRDLHDSLIRIEQTAESFGERLVLDFDVYMNRTANQANEGIKVLTALTAITLPPMLIGSWYGMNFKYMPELEHPSAYWIAMVVMISSMVGFSLWLKSKNWF